MALRYIDSMGDHYTAEQAPLKWTTASYVGRYPGLHGYGLRGVFLKGMLFPTNTILMEASIYRVNIPSSLFWLVGTEQESQIGCAFNDTGAIEVRQWASDINEYIYQSEPDRIRTGIWYHFGWKVFVHPSAGSVEVRLNGEVLCAITGICTTNGLFEDDPNPYYFSGTVGGFGLGDNANACIFDDLVVMDGVDDGISDPRLPGSGGFDQFLGPVIVAVKRPNAPGLAAAWTPVPSSNPNWDNVNDTESDDDATYNVADASAVGASDLFEMENLLATEDILGAQSLVLARKTDDGIAAIAKLIHNGGVTTPGATVYQPNSYSYMHAPEPTLPDGSLWTAAKWNAIQVGYKRIV